MNMKDDDNGSDHIRQNRDDDADNDTLLKSSGLQNNKRCVIFVWFGSHIEFNSIAWTREVEIVAMRELERLEMLRVVIDDVSNEVTQNDDDNSNTSSSDVNN